MSDHPRALVAPHRQQRSDPGTRTAPRDALRVDGMSYHAIPETTSARSNTGDQPVGEKLAHWQLPTMQRNALSKVFDRPVFTPGEVVSLGRRRLERAEGIGRKGLATIIEWLRGHGYELAGDTHGPRSLDLAASPKDVKKVEKAMRVLQAHGYTVLGSEPSEDGGTVCCALPKAPGISA